jgi:hypothetical protein
MGHGHLKCPSSEHPLDRHHARGNVSALDVYLHSAGRQIADSIGDPASTALQSVQARQVLAKEMRKLARDWR